MGFDDVKCTKKRIRNYECFFRPGKIPRVSLHDFEIDKFFYRHPCPGGSDVLTNSACQVNDAGASPASVKDAGPFALAYDAHGDRRRQVTTSHDDFQVKFLNSLTHTSLVCAERAPKIAVHLDVFGVADEYRTTNES